MYSPINISTSASLDRSIINIDKLLTYAKKYDYKYLGICEDKIMQSSYEFYIKCKKHNIKPIIGLHIRFEKNDLYLYAKNDDGLKNLFRLSSLSLSNKNDIDFNCLDLYKCDLICVCDLSLVKANDIFNKEDVYDITQIAFNKVLYYEKDNVDSCKLYCDILQNNSLDIDNKHLLTKEEANKLFNLVQINNLKKLVDKVDINFDIKSNLPIINDSRFSDSKDHLQKLANKGLYKRLNNNVGEVYLKRLDYELKIIFEKKLENYFLIVQDFILYAKRNNIFTGPGRGSACSCLVSYAIGISEIDPIKYDLLFERFLNPKRSSSPDIDVDFHDLKRQEIINYLIEKYGKDNVAHILTFQTFKPKQLVNDIASTLRLFIDKNKFISLSNIDKHKYFIEAYKNEKLFSNLVESKNEYRLLFKHCTLLENLNKNYSLHASGIVLSNIKLNEVTPLIKYSNDIATQFSSSYLELQNLVKFDILSLKTLRYIDEIVNVIKLYKNDFNLNSIDLKDRKTFNLLKNGYLETIFQLESNGMRQTVIKVKPESIEELSDILALYRPGPKEYIDKYVENKFNKTNIKYFDESIKEIIDKTYGIVLYQEQLMMIVEKLANFDYSKADILRSAISKKNQSLLLSLKDDFISGCRQNSIEENKSLSIWKMLMAFGDYGFNKSHSIAYSHITYYMAYLKANYTAIYFKTMINDTLQDGQKVLSLINEARNLNLNVIYPTINSCFSQCVCKDNNLYLPITISRNISKQVSQIIESINFKSKYFIHIIIELFENNIDIKVVESLISIGFFDSLNINRLSMIDTLPHIEEHLKIVGKSNIEAIKQVNKKDDYLKESKYEFEQLGFYLTRNPFVYYRKYYPNKTVSLLNYKSNLYCIVEIKSLILFKKSINHAGKLYVVDDKSSMEIVLSHDIYIKNKDMFVIGNIIIFRGKLSQDKQVIFVNEVEKINV